MGKYVVSVDSVVHDYAVHQVQGVERYVSICPGHPRKEELVLLWGGPLKDGALAKNSHSWAWWNSHAGIA